MKLVKILLRLFIFLVVGVLVGVAGWKVSQIKNQANRNLLFPELKVDDITQLEVYKDQTGKTFIKNNNQWQEENATASANIDDIKNALEAVTKLTRKDLVSQNPDKQAVFGLTEKEALKITLKNGPKTLAQFYIGKRAQNYLSNFIRKEDESNVYLSSSPLDSLFENLLSAK